MKRTKLAAFFVVLLFGFIFLFLPTHTMYAASDPSPSQTETNKSSKEIITARVMYRGLRVRLRPTVSARSLGALYIGDQVTVIGRSGNWLNVTTRFGSGWIASRYVKLSKPIRSIPVIKISTVKAQTAVHAELTEMARTVPEQIVPDPITTKPIVDEPKIAAKVAVQRNTVSFKGLSKHVMQNLVLATVIVPEAILRNQPSDAAIVLRTVRQGYTFLVIGKDPTFRWLLVQDSAGPGWVAIDSVSTSGSLENVPTTTASVLSVPPSQSSQPQPVPPQPQPPQPIIQPGQAVAHVNQGRLRVRQGPSTQTATLGFLLTGEDVGVVARTADSAWLQVNTRFGTGWIARQFTTLNVDVNALLVIQNSPPFATVKFRQGVRVRMGPSTQYPVVKRFRQGIGLQVIGSNGSDWLQVLLPDGGAGWLRIDTVTLWGTIQQVPVLTVPAVAQIVSYRVRIRHDPTIASQVLSVGKLGQVYTVVGRDTNRTWWQIQGDFGTGWISARYVRVAGVPGSVPVVAR
jgi:uncharacterized protein YgiM (DUF1202 family)